MKIALVGNPNSGKTTIFNAITGLRQKVGNFPGVTVEAKSGIMMRQGNRIWECIDFPGAYSIHPNAKDEFILTRALLDANDRYHPDFILYVVDVQLIERQLLLLSQIHDLGFAKAVVLSNTSGVPAEDVDFYQQLIENQYQCRVFIADGRAFVGNVKEFFREEANTSQRVAVKAAEGAVGGLPLGGEHGDGDYKALLEKMYAPHWDACAANPERRELVRIQIEDTLSRYQVLDAWFGNRSHYMGVQHQRSRRLDRVLTHPLLGTLIFLVLFFFIFQAIYSWARYPMDFIEHSFDLVAKGLRSLDSEDSWWMGLIADGLIPGLTGVIMFVPQIFILFFLIGILEESGYMARVIYLFEHLLNKVGLNGRSIVGLVSGGACAVPAIMSTRTIADSRDRLVTMFVIPLIPCSARIPVYTALIGFVVPQVFVWNFFNLQGIFFMGLYMLGIGVAIAVAWLLYKLYPERGSNILALHLPDYKWPPLKSIALGTIEKLKTFVTEAGKIIVAIAVFLWLLATHSWPGELDKVRIQAQSEAMEMFSETSQRESHVAAKLLENSFAGKLGKAMEKYIAPLGFDWKIGIALLTSFAAREVFVGTMSTIYSLGRDTDEYKLREKLMLEKRPDGRLMYDSKTALSLILFYAFAMQCMSTFAVMYKETKGYFWPVVQFFAFGALAYLSSLAVYQLL